MIRPRPFHVFFGLAIALFLFSCVLPKETYQHLRNFFFPRVYLLWLLVTGLVLVKCYFCFREKPGHHRRFLWVAPFLLLFFWGSYRSSLIPEHVWGVDDAYYYSYLPSVYLDGDLDLSNQYDASGLRSHQDPEVFERKTERGLIGNIFPVGCAIFWSPFFVTGHGIARVIHALGGAVELDGYSRPYTQSVVLGDLLLTVCGYYLIYLTLARLFTGRIAAVSTAAVLITTPYNWLGFKIFHLVSEHLSLAVIAAMVWFVTKSEGKWRNPVNFFLGIFAGLAIIVRFHNGIFLLLPAFAIVIAGFQARRAGQADWMKKTSMSVLLLVAGVCIGILPQLIVWKWIYGEWFVDIVSGHLVWWRDPLVLETLFSARKGLFPWSPLLLLSVSGLFLFAYRKRKWGVPFALIFLMTVYLNSSQSDWWGSVSIGARRFVPVSILFAVGFGDLYEWSRGKFRVAGEVLLICLVIFFANMNFFLVGAFARGALQFDHADRFSDVFDEWPRKAYLPFVYSAQLPVQLYYRLRFGIPLYGPYNEFFIGEEVLYFVERTGTDLISSASPLFGKGWTFTPAAGGNVARTTGPVSDLYVPMFYKDRPAVWMELDLKTVESETPVRVEFLVNGNLVRTRKVTHNRGTIIVPILRKESASRVNEIRLRFQSDSGGTVPGLELQSVHFRRKSA